MADTRIALGVQPLAIPDQSASLQKALTLNALMGQSDLQNLNIQEGQRTLRRNAQLDDAASQGGSIDDYLSRLQRIDPSAAFKLQQSIREGQKTQGEIDKSGRESDAAHASAIINAAPADRPAVYAQLRQQAIASGNKNAAASPPEWNDALMPHIIAQQQQGLATKDALERQDEARAGTVVAPPPVPASPTVAALTGAPPPAPVATPPQGAIDPTSGATVRALSAPQPPPAQSGAGTALGGGSGIVGLLGLGGQGSPSPTALAGGSGPVGGGTDNIGMAGSPAPGAAQVIPPMTASSSFEAETPGETSPTKVNAPVPGTSPDVVADKVEVVRKDSSMTPEDYRHRADALRAQGTKAGRDAAKEDYTAANQLETRIQMEQRNTDINNRFGAREDRIKAAQEGADIRPEDAKFIAQQVVAGNPNAATGFARNNKAKAAIARAITDEAQAQNIGAKELTAIMAQYRGLNAAETTLGHRDAVAGMAVQETRNLAPLVLEASANVDRTEYSDLNKILISARMRTGDPNVVKLGQAINGYINTYARAINPSGTPTVSDKDHAREILQGAWSQGQIEAGIGQLDKELDAALKSPRQVRDRLKAEQMGKPEPETPAVTPSAKPKGAGDGTQASPYVIKGDDGFSALKKGQYFVAPDGSGRIMQK